MKKQTMSITFIAAVFSVIFLAACSSNAYWSRESYIFKGILDHGDSETTDPDSNIVDMVDSRYDGLLSIHSFMIYPVGICLYTLEDRLKQEYTLFIIPHHHARIKGDYELINVGDTLNITLKVSKKYPKYSPDYYRLHYGKGHTAKERLGIIYTSDDVVNIRGRLFLKKK